MKKSKKSAISKGVSKKGMTAAAVGAAALGAGAYYLMGPDRKAHQKKAKDLMAKMQKEVGSELKKAKVVGTPMYHKAIDMISENYAKQYAMHAPEIKMFAKRLKGEWASVAKKVAPKTAKKATKTSAKKSK
jgi:hypothetical protein